jgi:CheY-like chemotaxis protein/DNA-directed RNA polymerase specialized sigma24 family protein
MELWLANYVYNARYSQGGWWRQAIPIELMSLSASVAPHLPYLRRFARALTGTQSSGDAYVGAVLESLITDASILKSASSPKIGLYQTLCALWGSVSLNSPGDTSQPSWEATVQGRLAHIPGPARQVFLLSAVEGFGRREIGEIIKRSDQDVDSLFEDANRQISELIASDILIIEDEPLIALDIEDTITSLGHRCVGIARTHKEAVRLAREKRPQLVLSDIQLADGSSGIDAVNDILGSFDVPVIFITAFPERLLTGERPEPAFLITKPFSPEMVKALIAQALFFDLRSKKAA